MHSLSSANRYSHHGPVINPHPFLPSSQDQWRLRERRSAGGSSGGSSAAVAMGLCDVSVAFLLNLRITHEQRVVLWGPTQAVQYVCPRHIVGSPDINLLMASSVAGASWHLPTVWTVSGSWPKTRDL